jgi:spore coat protein A
MGTLPLPAVSVVPEAFLDTTLVNGACYPYLNVESRRYRFRILNGANARFYNLQLYYADATGKEADLTKGGPPFIQIGTEGGFLPHPVVLNNPPIPTPLLEEGTADVTRAFNLLLAPAERADVIIDFSSVPVGSKLILYSDTPAPFPSGDARNDYFTGDPDQTAFGGSPTTQPGFGPNTRTLMQFRVVPLSGSPDTYDFAATLDLLDRALPLAYANQQPRDLDPTGLAPLGKTLNEDFDKYGRLLQRLGTTDQNGFNNQGLPTWGRNFQETPITERASQGETQVWNIFNLTGDTHPIHFHLVNVQIISRAPFDEETPDFNAIGTERPPDPNERGWKETVRMNPAEVTKVIMRFDAPDPRVVQPWVTFATSPRTGGYEYVWHCHILEHEEHDMMRNLVVF